MFLCAAIGTEEPIECFTKQYGGISIHVYDTRGFFSWYGEDDDILAAIQQARPGCDYDVVVVCMIYYGRFDRDQRSILEIIHKLKSDIWSRTHIVLTHTDCIPPHEYERSNEYDQSKRSQWKENITHYLNSSEDAIGDTDDIDRNCNGDVLISGCSEDISIVCVCNGIHVDTSAVESVELLLRDVGLYVSFSMASAYDVDSS